MLTILDVSSFQGPAVDWAAVKASTSPVLDAAYVKLTEGTSGTGSVDSCGAGNLQRARAAGVPVGAYHFLSALSAPDAQAQHLLQQLEAAGASDGDLPPMLDVERGANGNLPPAAWVGVWMAIVEKALGKVPLLYTGAWVAALEHFGSFPEYARYPGWVAAYTSAPAPPLCPPWGAWGTATGPLIWQFTPKAAIPGVPSPCDLSRAQALPGATTSASSAPLNLPNLAPPASVVPDTQPSSL